jgi:hypothetical protein
MKKVCGGKHHTHVDVDINKDGHDVASVSFDNSNDGIKHDIMLLCNNYGLGKEYVSIVTDAGTNQCTIYVSLNKPY